MLRIGLRWILAFAIASPAGAQTAAAAAGQRVRVRNSSTERPVVGTLVSADSARIRVVDGRDTVDLAREWVRSVEVSTARHRHPLEGLGIGLAGGMTLGALLGAASYQPCEHKAAFDCFLAPESRGQSAMFGAVVLGALGAPIGLLIGSLNQWDKWAPASIATTAHIQLIPRREGLGAQLSLSF